MFLLRSLRSLATAFILPFTVDAVAQTSLTWNQLYEPGVGGRVDSIAVSPHSGQNRVLSGGDMLGIAVSDDLGNSWTQKVTGLYGYEINDFTYHPTATNTIWAGTMSGPYKSTDGGRTWVLKANGLPASEWGKFTHSVNTVLIDPNNSNRLLALFGERRYFDIGRSTNFGAVYESTNGGESWTLKGRIDPASLGGDANVLTAAFAAGSSSVVFASVPGYGIMKSTNGGATWAAANNGLPSADVTCVVTHPTNANVLWTSMGDGSGVYKSTNQGSNWTALNGTGSNILELGGKFTAVAVCKANTNVLWATATGQNDQGAVYRTTNGGLNWTKVRSGIVDEPYGVSMNPEQLAVDPKNDQVAFTGSAVAVYRTTDGGATWKDVTAYQPSGTTNWRGTGYSGLVTAEFTWNPFNKNVTIASALDDGKLMLSTDNLQTWKVHHANIGWYEGGTDASFSGSSGNTIYAAIGGQDQWFATGGLFKSTNGGASWTELPRPADTRDVCTDVYANPVNPNIVFAVFRWNGGGESLFRSTNGGTSWTYCSLPYPDGYDDWRVMDVIGNSVTGSPSVYYAAAYHGTYRSTDAGVTWVYIGGHWSGDWGNINLNVDPSDPNVIYTAHWGNGCWNDGVARWDGTSWNRLAGGDGAPFRIYNVSDIAVDPTNSQRLVATTNENPFDDISDSSGVWVSDNRGVTWYQQNNGLGMLRANCVTFAPDGSKIVVGTNGGGYYVADLAPSAPGGSGLAATYYNNMNFTGTSVSRTDANLIFDWGNGSPDSTIGPDTFSARWQGQVQAESAGNYRFATRSDDGVRVWIGGVQVINNWTNHGPTWDETPNISFAAGEKKAITIEYYENTGGATFHFNWLKPGSTEWVAIPAARLYPSAASAPNLVINPGFESNSANWLHTSTDWGIDNSQVRSGTKSLWHWGAQQYEEYTYQNITGLSNGLYTLRAWVWSTGGQTEASMWAGNYGGDWLSTAIPGNSSWNQITIPNINVTNGQCEIGFWSVSGTDYWLAVDDVELRKQ